MPKDPPTAFGKDPVPTQRLRTININPATEDLLHEILKELRDLRRDFRVVFGGHKKDG